MDPETHNLVTQYGALGVLVYLAPVLRSIAVSLRKIASATTAATEGLRDAGVPLDGPPPTVRGSVAALVRHLAPKAAAVLLVAVLVAGCSCTGAVAKGLGDLQHDFDLYRRASVARVESQADLHRELGRAVQGHIEAARRLAER